MLCFHSDILEIQYFYHLTSNSRTKLSHTTHECALTANDNNFYTWNFSSWKAYDKYDRNLRIPSDFFTLILGTLSPGAFVSTFPFLDAKNLDICCNTTVVPKLYLLQKDGNLCSESLMYFSRISRPLTSILLRDFRSSSGT